MDRAEARLRPAWSASLAGIESGRVEQHAGSAFQQCDRCLAGGNPLPPDLMTADERLTETAQICAAGILRLRRQEAEKHVSHLEKNGLDFSPDRSVHATARQRRQVPR
jgi:hypothetical protein